MAGHVVIGGVVPDGPAAKFGLQQGDIILTVRKKRSVRARSFTRKCGKSIRENGSRSSILRDDQSFDLEIVGGDRADRYRS